MADFPVYSGAVIHSATGAVDGRLYGLKIQCAVANIKGPWASLLTTTSYASQGMLVSIFSPTGAMTYCVDIGIGAAGAERVILHDLFLNTPRAGQGCTTVFVPCNIPQGTPVRARTQSSAAGQLYVSCELASYGFATPSNFTYQSITTLGVQASLSTTTATRVTCSPTGSTPAASGVPGQWYPIETSTPADVQGMWMSLGNNNSTAMLTEVFRLDLGTGTAGSETVLVRDLPVVSNTTSDNIDPQELYLPISLPKGSRFVVRGQVSGKTATNLQVGFYGMTGKLS